MFLSKIKTSGRHQPDVTGLIGQYAHEMNQVTTWHIYITISEKQVKLKNMWLKFLMNIILKTRRTLEIGCGQMSSWYVLSSLGFYPVIPEWIIMQLEHLFLKNKN